MADLSSSKLSSSLNSPRFPLFLPLNISPHPKFCSVRFSPLRRRFSRSSLITKLSSDSTRLDIISTSENSDGSVVFKFGDPSEVSQSVDNVEVSDTMSHAQCNGDFVEDEQNRDLISTAEVEETSDFERVEHDGEIVDIVGTTCDSSVASSEEMRDDDKLEYGENERGLNVEPSDMVMSMEDREIDENVKHGVDEDYDMVEVMSVQLEAETILDEETSSDSVDVVALGSVLGSNEVINAAAPAIGQSDEYPCTSEFSEETAPGPEASGITLAESGQDSAKEDISTSRLSMPSVAPSSLPLEVHDNGHPSISRIVEDPCTTDISDPTHYGPKASVTTSTEPSFDSADMSSAAASLPHCSEVNEASPPTIAQFDDDQHSSDISEAAGPGPGSSGMASAETSIDSMQISRVALSASPVAASLSLALEANDAAIPTISQSDADQFSDISVAAGPDPGTPELLSTETCLDSSLNVVDISAPALSMSSAAASLAHPEALTGGKDAYFVCENWFGVADGVGQWSFEGIDAGLYATQFMQNCEKLALESQSAGITNTKELIQQSAAMTQSTGSARVLIAHYANQVLHVANIGDSGFVIIRNQTIFKKSCPMVHEFNFPYAIGSSDDSVEDIEEYDTGLEDGDVIVTATDGLFDNLYDQEIATIVSKAMEAGTKMQDLAEQLATKAQEVGRSTTARSPFADAAQAAGHTGYNGGKLDHVTVIVSLVQRR